MKKLLYLIALLCLGNYLSAQSIDGMEYAFDTDPGVGQATYVNLPNLSSIDTLYHFNLSSLSPGQHTLIVRMKDTGGDWGQTQYSDVFVTNGTTNLGLNYLHAIEYRIDSIQGTPQYVTMPAQTAAIDTTVNLDLSGLSPGLHHIYVRADSVNSPNSNYVVMPVVVMDGSLQTDSISAFEVFFDSDPGLGNGTSYAVNKNASIDTTLTIDLSALSPGYHTMYLRSDNNNSPFSQYITKPLLVNTGTGLDSIVAMEAFFDTDPGLGQGISVPLTQAPEVDTTVEIMVPSNLTASDHIMYVRTQDNAGNWSHYTADTVKICTVLPVVAGFDALKFSNSIHFIDTSQNTNTYHWNFGDGSTDTSAFPVHVYNIGVYQPLQTVSNACNTDTISSVLIVEGIESFEPKVASIRADFILEIYGAGLDTTDVVWLQKGNTKIYPSTKAASGFQKLSCFFDLHSVTTLGLYDLYVNYNASNTDTFKNAIVIQNKDTISPLQAQAKIRPLVRAGRWYDGSIVLSNQANYLKKGNVYLVAVSDQIETNLQGVLRKQSIDFAHQYLNKDSVGNLVVPRDTVAKVYDFLNYLEIDTFLGQPFLGKLYILMTPLINSKETVEIPFRYRATGSGAKIAIVPFNQPSHGSPMNNDFAGYIHDVGMMGAAGLGAIPHPAAQLVSKFADEIDQGSQIFFAELFDAIEGTNVANSDFYKNQAVNYLTGKATAFLSKSIVELPSQSATSEEALKYMKHMDQLYDDAITIFNRPKSLSQLISGFTKFDASNIKIMTPEHCFSAGWRILTSGALGLGNNIAGNYVSSLLPSWSNPNNIQTVASFDPNAIYGPNGFGMHNYIESDLSCIYTISFENMDTATAPAQVVRVIDTLDLAKFDIKTFEFGDIIVGDSTLSVPSNRKEYAGTLDLKATTGCDVKVTMELDTLLGIAKWNFISLDSNSGRREEDPLDGFLPPNVSSPEGEGFVSFKIQLKDGLNHLDTVNDQASIYFDENDPIQTNIWSNIIDLESPTSWVSHTIINDSTVLLEFNGTDIHSGIADFELFYSKNNDPFQTWGRLSKPSQEFVLPADTIFEFYTRATDRVGNTEQKTPLAEATVILSTDIPMESEQEIRLYPTQLSGDLLHLESPRIYDNVSVEITNVLGQKVMYREIGTMQSGLVYDLDLSLEPGIYMIAVHSGTQLIHSSKVNKTN